MNRLVMSIMAVMCLVMPAGLLQAFDLTGTLRHGGVPMPTITSIEPTFWFRDEASGTTYEQAIASYSPSTGGYEIQNLSGTIGMSIVFHVAGEVSTLPGNYRLWKIVDETASSPLDIEMPIIIHIIRPWDNGIIRDWIPPYPYYSPSLTFRWDAVPGASRYVVRLQECKNGVCTDILSDQNVQGTVHHVSLPHSAVDEHYECIVQAFMGSEVIGTNLTTFSGGYGSHKFKVRSASGSSLWLLLND
jgi:hypothetical protein